ncbi:MAG TPA: methionyl-tRNA formyltransferase [Candidatus Paceibacterota bacterium]|nr:methionyl-tRNA formyltransferase [Candidatus Paceibacterota bacterium]
MRFAFFGTRPLAAGVLAELNDAGLIPEKSFESADITPAFIAELASQEWDVFVVASFGKILPKAFLDIPRRGVINMHPSLLPRLRGPSPVRSAILLNERDTGVTIMRLNEKMDQGPIIAQRKVAIPEWPPYGRDLDALLAREGGKLLAEMLPQWVAGEIDAVEQNHDVATYCKIFTKEDGLLDLKADAYENLLKIRAFDGWPGTYAFFERAGKKIRVQILDAEIINGKLQIMIVKPEGKGEMRYDAFLNSGARPV